MINVHRYLESHGLLRRLSYAALGRFLALPLKTSLVLFGVGIVNGAWWGFDEGFAWPVTRFYGFRWVFLGVLAMALGCCFQCVVLLWKSTRASLLRASGVFFSILACIAVVSAIPPLFELLYSELHWQAPGSAILSVPILAALVSTALHFKPPVRKASSFLDLHGSA